MSQLCEISNDIQSSTKKIAIHRGCKVATRKEVVVVAK